MTFFDSFLSILGSFYNLDFCRYWLFPLFCLFFIASFPCIIRSLITWR